MSESIKGGKERKVIKLFLLQTFYECSIFTFTQEGGNGQASGIIYWCRNRNEESSQSFLYICPFLLLDGTNITK